MSSYSVATAKDGLPGLIDRALAGDEVIITRRGKPVVELRAIASEPKAKTDMAWLRARRDARPASNITSVEILRQMYEDKD